MSFFLGIIQTGSQTLDARLLDHLRRQGKPVIDEPGAWFQREGSNNDLLIDDDIAVFVDGPVYAEGQAAAKAVAEAWRHWGPAFIKHLNGDFSAVVWDRRSRTLHLFRDPMGTRRLYWSFNRGIFRWLPNSRRSPVSLMKNGSSLVNISPSISHFGSYMHHERSSEGSTNCKPPTGSD